jgi:anthranilate 1,2-dioxygenase small subunit
MEWEPRARVEDLLYAYAEALDEGALEDWPRLFREDAHYRLIPRENHQRGLAASLMWCSSRAMMEDRVVAIREASVFSPHVCRHLYTNVRVEDGGQAGHLRARANYALLRTGEDGQTCVLSVGRVLAGVELLPEPRFTHMDVVYETLLIAGLLVYPI